MKGNRYEVFTSIMIAVVSILSAVTAWRATVAESAASDADFNGISAAIRAQEAGIVNAVRAYEHKRAYTHYFRYNELGNLMWETADPALEREQSELWGVALGLQYSFFPVRYVNRDGGYDLERELDELWADSLLQDDINPQPHFEMADNFRDQSFAIASTLALFAISFFLFTVGQAIRNKLRYLFALAGLGMMFVGIAALLFFEWAF
jgi:hypothetical protein